ncbi:sensor histidine kinase [Brevibacterium litoralis]|uniref:sensor histidine kinase n=1 Tax=Brevibacterium litoralis TaxID=3138935 RepID=UPI003D9A4C7F
MLTLVTLVLTGTSSWVLANLRASLIERTDQRLIDTSSALAVEAAEIVFTPTPETTNEQESRAEESLRDLLPPSYYVQFYLLDGTRVYDPVSPTTDNTPALPTIDSQTVSYMNGSPFTVNGTGSQWRVRALKVENSDLLVAIAIPFDADVDAISERARNTMVGIGLLAFALVAGVGYFLITNTFRPLKDIEKTASRIAAGDLSQRVTPYPRGTELGRLSAALNTMLGHIEDSFDGQTRSEKRMRQFISDASHELRTPLVTIRGYAELHRVGALTDPEHLGQAMGRIEAEAKRLGVLVDDLVVLARLDEKRATEIGAVDIGAIVRDAAADAAAQAPDRDIAFLSLSGGDAEEVPAVLGSEAKLRQVIVNLAANAVRHTPEGTAIEFAVGVVGRPGTTVDPDTGETLTVDEETENTPDTGRTKDALGFVTGPVRILGFGNRSGNKENDGGSGQEPSTPDGPGPAPDTGSREPQRSEGLTGEQTLIRPDVTAAGGVSVSDRLAGFPDGRVRFEVRDHGEGIDPELVPRIFERFYRLDASRTRDTGGSGLGLSIVKAIVESHQGEISVHPTPGGGATFRVDLPVPPSNGSGTAPSTDGGR